MIIIILIYLCHMILIMKLMIIMINVTIIKNLMIMINMTIILMIINKLMNMLTNVILIFIIIMNLMIIIIIIKLMILMNHYQRLMNKDLRQMIRKEQISSWRLTTSSAFDVTALESLKMQFIKRWAMEQSYNEDSSKILGDLSIQDLYVMLCV